TVRTGAIPLSRWGIPLGGQAGLAARMVKYAPKNVAKNMASDATNRTIPRMGPLVARATRSSEISAALILTPDPRAPPQPAVRRTPVGWSGLEEGRRSCVAGRGHRRAPP